MFSFEETALSICNTSFMPIEVLEQILILESIEDFRQNLNLSPRTNPMKAMTRNPSSYGYKNDRFLRNRDAIKTLQVKLLKLVTLSQRLPNLNLMPQ